ncbi:MAG: hypothetical protein ABIA04_07185 [Pseudomonadota bacterium]
MLKNNLLINIIILLISCSLLISGSLEITDHLNMEFTNLENGTVEMKVSAIQKLTKIYRQTNDPIIQVRIVFAFKRALSDTRLSAGDKLNLQARVNQWEPKIDPVLIERYYKLTLDKFEDKFLRISTIMDMLEAGLEVEQLLKLDLPEKHRERLFKIILRNKEKLPHNVSLNAMRNMLSFGAKLDSAYLEEVITTTQSSLPSRLPPTESDRLLAMVLYLHINPNEDAVLKISQIIRSNDQLIECAIIEFQYNRLPVSSTTNGPDFSLASQRLFNILYAIVNPKEPGNSGNRRLDHLSHELFRATRLERTEDILTRPCSRLLADL